MSIMSATGSEIAARTAECLRIVGAPWLADDVPDLELGAKVGEMILRFVEGDDTDIESGCVRVVRDDDESSRVYVLVGYIHDPGETP